MSTIRSSPAPDLTPGTQFADGTPNTPAIVVEDLRKAFGPVRALNGLSLRVRRGECFGLIGPGLSGKTTALRILATLIPADMGAASLLNHDLRVDARQARRSLGYVGQQAGLDVRLSGWQNVVLIARLHGLGRRAAEQGADEILAALDSHALGALTPSRYTSSQRALVAIAAALAHRPPILLLDDPAPRLSAAHRTLLWRYLGRRVRDDGTTILLATQGLDDAEPLCGRVGIIDHGQILASGNPAELKAQVSGHTLIVRPLDPRSIPDAQPILGRMGGVRAVRPLHDRIELEVTGAHAVPMVLRVLEEHELGVREITLSRPSLDEVFFRHTGRKIRESREQPASGVEVPGHR